MKLMVGIETGCPEPLYLIGCPSPTLTTAFPDTLAAPFLHVLSLDAYCSLPYQEFETQHSQFKFLPIKGIMLKATKKQKKRPLKLNHQLFCHKIE